MQTDQSNRTALVTGATSGIGRALCSQLREKGVDVFATGRDTDRLEELKREISCQGATFDLESLEGPHALYDAAVEALGAPPDIVVNNAGYNTRKAPLIEVVDDELEAQWRVNLRAPFLLCRRALTDMAERGDGHIVNVISSVVHFGVETMGLYSTMKQGLGGLTAVLIKEARPHGVKVTAVYPGGTDTNFRDVERPEYMRPESAAHMICDALFAPPDVVVHELTFRPLAETNF